jgi:hypothetical protein
MWTLVAAVGLFALSAYIKKEVNDSGKLYLPSSVWSQWAGERGEWRGKVDQKLETIEREREADRRDLEAKIHLLDVKLEKIITIATLTKELLQDHEAKSDPPFVRPKPQSSILNDLNAHQVQTFASP